MSLSSGTTSSNSSQSSSTSSEMQTCSAFFMRLKLVGDCGIPARMAYCASVSSPIGLPK